MSWSPFPPRTTEVQFDEKWSFVAKKEANCDRADPADAHKGDYWDHVAFDPEHRLVVAVVPGARDIEGTEALVGEFHRRTEGRTMRLMTSDSYPAYETAILGAYGETVTPPRTGKPGRPKSPFRVPRPDLVYATIEKVRKKGRVVEILTRVVFGTMAAVAAALAGSRVSRAINTSFIERQNATDRHHNARKSRKTYRFSKDWRFHEAATYFTMYSDNFCWPVRTLREQSDEGRWRKRTPAMSAGLSDRVWSISEWISRPAVLRS
jgi:IS1 family transposase